MIHEFNDKFEYSLGDREKMDLKQLKLRIPGCVQVVKTDAETDRKEKIDYVATLRHGAIINIDAKTRERGASRFWRHGEPELALEIYSVKPNGIDKGKTGWTLKEDTNVDMILYTFHRTDTNKYYLLPFQHLRMAFIRNYKYWKRIYPVKEEKSKRNGWKCEWKSEAMFVPASVVIDAIKREMEAEAS